MLEKLDSSLQAPAETAGVLGETANNSGESEPQARQTGGTRFPEMAEDTCGALSQAFQLV